MNNEQPDLHTEMKNQASTRDEAFAYLESLKGKKLKNLDQNIEATISSRQTKKMISGVAVNKSMNNGFTAEEHYLAAANVEGIFLMSKLHEWHEDKNENPGLEAIGRFEGSINLNGEVAIARLTLKKTTEHGNKIYSLELKELKKPLKVQATNSSNKLRSTSNG